VSEIASHKNKGKSIMKSVFSKINIIGVVFLFCFGIFADVVPKRIKYLEVERMAYRGSTELTIASGVITKTRTVHTVDGEGDLDDTLDTINGGAAGDYLIIIPESTGRNITISTAGNILMPTPTMLIPDNGTVALYYDGSNWLLAAASSSPAGSTGDVQYNDAGGVFGAESTFNYDSVTDTLVVSNINLLFGVTVDTIETTLTNDDTHLPTSGAVYALLEDRIEDGTAAGQVLFYDGSKWVHTELSEFNFDDAAKRVGINRTTPDKTLHVGGEIKADSHITVGDSAAGIDYTITFDGEDDNGIITFDEDNSEFETDRRIKINSGTQVDSITVGGGSAGIDYQVVFDGENNDGSITFMEDEDRFDINEPVKINTNVANAVTIGNGAAGVDYIITIDGASNDGEFVYHQADNVLMTLPALNSVNIDGKLDFIEEAGAPPAPASGIGRMYVRDDGGMEAPMFKDSGGSEYNLITGASSGIVGPTSSTDNAAIRWNGASGNIAQDSKLFIDDAGSVVVGDGAAGVDYTITFDGEDSDGTVTWDEDNSEFEIDSDVNLSDGEDVRINNISVLSLPVPGGGSSGNNIAIGGGGKALTGGGDHNTFVGIEAGKDYTIGTCGVAVGYRAAYANTTGLYNTAIGYQTLYANLTGDNNTAVGRRALFYCNGGLGNTGIGCNALIMNVSGDYNTAVGVEALNDNTVNSNTAVGYQCLMKNTTGTGNAGLGYQAGYTCITGHRNTAIGHSTLYYASNNDNTGVGYHVLDAQTNGYNNTGVGSQSLGNTTIGINNAGFGSGSGASIATGSENTCLGTGADVSASNSVGEIVIGYNTVGNGSNTCTIDNIYSVSGGVANVYVSSSNQLMRATSSSRYKTNINYDDIDLTNIYGLKPASFVYVGGEKEYIGFIAEDVAEVEPRLVEFDKNGRPDAVCYDHITALLTSAVQELKKQNDELKKRIEALENQ